MSRTGRREPQTVFGLRTICRANDCLWVRFRPERWLKSPVPPFIKYAFVPRTNTSTQARTHKQRVSGQYTTALQNTDIPPRTVSLRHGYKKRSGLQTGLHIRSGVPNGPPIRPCLRTGTLEQYCSRNGLYTRPILRSSLTKHRLDSTTVSKLAPLSTLSRRVS